MKRIILLLLLAQTSLVMAQSYEDTIVAFQHELNTEYQNPEKSPLGLKDFKRFKGHTFFPIDEKFKVKARFDRTENAQPFQMKTSSSRLPTYEAYGIATFELDGKEYQLHIYQSHSLRETVEYQNYLFLPFTDLTNGETTYGGGRYIDLEIPETDYIVIDFNKAYNPYCAYSKNYSCPIPPRENDLAVHIEAGIRN